MSMESDVRVIVADIMHHQVFTIGKNETVADAIALMQLENVRTLIIKPEDQYDSYGIITVRDVVYQVIARRISPAIVKVSEIMRSPCIMMYPDLDIYEAAQRLAAGGIQRAPVIGFSDYGDDKLLGIISLSDIVMKLELNALTGEGLVAV
ncbi:MAG: CBS domain-containing protein [Symploca sp. SIO2B6]|nr:CBS domain-containing protein [Symploca sp. SIO2B6]